MCIRDGSFVYVYTEPLDMRGSVLHTQHMTTTAAKVARIFRPGVRVVATDGAKIPSQQHHKRYGTVEGTVIRFVPMNNAQGGTVVVEWDHGCTGRHSAGSLTLASEVPDHADQ